MPAPQQRSRLKALLLSVLMVGVAPLISPSFANENPDRFFKIDESGQRLAKNSTEWQCIEDSNTKLYWQKRDPTSDLHDVNEYYNWYQPAQDNTGLPRSNPDLFPIDASCFAYEENNPDSYCNTQAFVQRVNDSNYCGFNDWRLPTVDELLSLAVETPAQAESKPAPPLDYFPFYDPFVYWTSSVDDEGVVLTVINGATVLNTVERTDKILIRLVRDSEASD